MPDFQRILTFESAGQVFALRTQRVREVVPPAHISPVADSAQFISGVMDLRHEMIPIVDLQRLFGGETTIVDDRTSVVVALPSITGEVSAVGLLVHRIRAAYRLAPDQFDPPPTVGGRNMAHYVEGFGRTADGMKIIIDIDRLLLPHGERIESAMPCTAPVEERVA